MKNHIFDFRTYKYYISGGSHDISRLMTGGKLKMVKKDMVSITMTKIPARFV